MKTCFQCKLMKLCLHVYHANKIMTTIRCDRSKYGYVDVGFQNSLLELLANNCKDFTEEKR